MLAVVRGNAWATLWATEATRSEAGTHRHQEIPANRRWARLGSNQRPLACEATAPEDYFAPICRAFINSPGHARADLLTWIAGICRGCGPRKRSVDQWRRVVKRRVSLLKNGFRVGEQQELSERLGRPSRAPSLEVLTRVDETRAPPGRDCGWSVQSRGERVARTQWLLLSAGRAPTSTYCSRTDIRDGVPYLRRGPASSVGVRDVGVELRGLVGRVRGWRCVRARGRPGLLRP